MRGHGCIRRECLGSIMFLFQTCFWNTADMFPLWQQRRRLCGSSLLRGRRRLCGGTLLPERRWLRAFKMQQWRQLSIAGCLDGCDCHSIKLLLGRRTTSTSFCTTRQLFKLLEQLTHPSVNLVLALHRLLEASLGLLPSPSFICDFLRSSNPCLYTTRQLTGRPVFFDRSVFAAIVGIRRRGILSMQGKVLASLHMASFFA
mmetsp:Transcript_59179/g.117260  ORF Transcript_59179/g.117260 Transcript_59179/m.117260 type:complete len:201 (+) Transcript_59179:222-824(+)